MIPIKPTLSHDTCNMRSFLGEKNKPVKKKRARRHLNLAESNNKTSPD